MTYICRYCKLGLLWTSRTQEQHCKFLPTAPVYFPYSYHSIGKSFICLGYVEKEASERLTNGENRHGDILVCNEALISLDTRYAI